jgi:iron complex transport system permease protein
MVQPDMTSCSVESSAKKTLNDVKSTGKEVFLRSLGLWGFLWGALIVTVMISLGLGRYRVPVDHVIGILASHILPVETVWTTTEARIVELIRLPRALLALISGAGLAVCGAVLQGVFRNPLVGPQIIGVSSGAGFGGALAILWFGSQAMTMVMAFGFGLAAMVLVYFMSRTDGRTPILMLVLAGVIVSAFFTALTSLIKFVADPYDKLPAIVVWLMGSFSTATYHKLYLAAGPILVAGLFLHALRFRVNIVSLGDEEAEAIGVKVDQVRWMILIGVTVVTSAVISAAGIIGWVGLVVPHMARMLVGPDHRVLLPASALIGGIYTLWIDNLARAATAAEIPLGIITAVIGAPVFGYLLKKTQGKGWKHD